MAVEMGSCGMAPLMCALKHCAPKAHQPLAKNLQSSRGFGAFITSLCLAKDSCTVVETTTAQPWGGATCSATSASGRAPASIRAWKRDTKSSWLTSPSGDPWSIVMRITVLSIHLRTKFSAREPPVPISTPQAASRLLDSINAKSFVLVFCPFITSLKVSQKRENLCSSNARSWARRTAFSNSSGGTSASSFLGMKDFTAASSISRKSTSFIHERSPIMGNKVLKRLSAYLSTRSVHICVCTSVSRPSAALRTYSTNFCTILLKFGSTFAAGAKATLTAIATSSCAAGEECWNC
mmetsp:Transcript_4272/g.7074  ORF Transcript_4272/g.7074 Transcript_4272/m.7074 type:complete len:294 (+) Transcript_4272:1003-1884(+)